MASFTNWGNDLYTGSRSIDFIGRRRLWMLISLVVILICVIGTVLRGGFVVGIEFRGGNEFQVPNAQSTNLTLATQAVDGVVANADPVVTTIGAGGDTIRVQTEALSQSQTNQVRDALASAYRVESKNVSANIVGPTWGADITTQAVRALIVFLVLVTLVMALYFRTWKMSVAALISLVHDLLITAGVYALAGFEVTPAGVIGFLTILGYSLYDTVVVFDKIRENTRADAEGSSRTFAQSVNLAVNQTLVRSINTSVVAVLPVASILFIGAYVLGAGTLRDIALALFIGIIVSTYSSIFIAAPLYVQFRQNEPAIRKQNQKKTGKAAGATGTAKSPAVASSGSAS